MAVVLLVYFFTHLRGLSSLPSSLYMLLPLSGTFTVMRFLKTGCVTHRGVLCVCFGSLSLSLSCVASAYKGIIDLAQMPPAILLAHPGVAGTPPLDRYGYIPGGQAPFPPRPFNPASISPGESPLPQVNTLVHSYYRLRNLTLRQDKGSSPSMSYMVKAKFTFSSI